MKDVPYTKREQDFFIQEFKEMFTDLKGDIQRDREERKAFEKSVAPIFRAVSDNSGEILLLKKSNDANYKATKIIEEISTTWKWGKIVITFVISTLLAIIAIKKIITGGVHDGLQALKNIIF